MDETVVRAKRAMMDQAACRVLVVNHARFDQTALYRLADLSEFDHVITDSPPSPQAQAALNAAGLKLTIATGKEAAA